MFTDKRDSLEDITCRLMFVASQTLVHSTMTDIWEIENTSTGSVWPSDSVSVCLCLSVCLSHCLGAVGYWVYCLAWRVRSVKRRGGRPGSVCVVVGGGGRGDGVHGELFFH